MKHMLNWTPGNHGKGIVTPEGEAHTWNVDRQDGTPNHQEYLEQALGAHDTNPYSEYNAFEIGPEGRVYEGPEDIDKLDPRLVPTNKWRFQSAAEGPVQVVDVNHPVKDEPHAPAYCEGPLDKPFAYDPVARTVYLGQPGGYHTDMVGYVPHDNVLGLPQGRLRAPHTETNSYTDDVEHTPVEADWFSKPPENHEEVHQALGAAPLTGKWAWSFQRGARVAKNDGKWQLVKMGMPIGEDFWQQWPGDLYHGTTEDRLPSIMRHGLQPWDSETAGGSNYNEENMKWLRPRPGHLYLSQDPQKAKQRAEEGSNGKNKNRPIVLKINPSYLQAAHINPDEDEMHWYIPDAPSPTGDRPPAILKGKSLGEYAEQHSWGQNPVDTERVLNDLGSIAYKGVVPPDAIDPGIVDWDESFIKKPVWRPIKYRRVGKAPIVSSWQPGQWGKGIYYPETGTLQIWSDDRTHLDVWNDDENVSQSGSAHHIIIRPNGTVCDQGAFDRNFGDAPGDTEGLQIALREFDPHLRLDPLSSWDFGNATEPMETEPSSVSRGEDGGSVHEIQTGSDFAGSL